MPNSIRIFDFNESLTKKLVTEDLSTFPLNASLEKEYLEPLEVLNHEVLIDIVYSQTLAKIKSSTSDIDALLLAELLILYNLVLTSPNIYEIQGLK